MIIERVPCGLCGRLAPQGYLLCARCALDLLNALDDIVRLYATLASSWALLPRTGGATRGSPGFRSTVPLNLDVVALTDRRTVARRPHDPHDVLGVLHDWAELVREQTGLEVRHPSTRAELREYKNVTTAVGVLVRMRDFIARRDWGADLLREVLQIRDALREALPKAVGDARGTPRRIGRCLAPLPGPDERGRTTCGHLLLAYPDDRVIRCPRCWERGVNTIWPRLYWPELGAALRAADNTTTEGETL